MHTKMHEMIEKIILQKYLLPGFSNVFFKNVILKRYVAFLGEKKSID